jgi:FO synthase
VTPDHVNPEAPWPHLGQLAAETAGAGKLLQERLAIYPSYVREAARWVDERCTRAVLAATVDAEGSRASTTGPGRHASRCRRSASARVATARRS